VTTYNTSAPNSFEATIEFNDASDCRRWASKFGDAVQYRSRKTMLLTVERDEDESNRLKGLCDSLFQAKITSKLSYDQYSVEQAYFILLSFETCFEEWVQEFGDWSRDEVKDELADLKYHDKLDGIKRKYLIVKCSDGEQVTIDAAIAFQNLTTKNN